MEILISILSGGAVVAVIEGVREATDKRIASMETHLRAIYKRADKEVREAWEISLGMP